MSKLVGACCVSHVLDWNCLIIMIFLEMCHSETKHVSDWHFANIVIIRRQIDITTYQIRKIKADTSLCLFADELVQII